MSDKLSCPGCGSHSSAIYRAVKDDGPCPHCGLSAAAILEVLGARERGANAELTARYEAAVIRADKAEDEATNLRKQLDDIRTAANLDPASYRSPYEHREWP